jgi:hypothetical protein
MASLRETRLDSGKITGRATIARHRAYDFLGEHAGLARHSDQHRRPRIFDDVEEIDAVGTRPGPAVDGSARLDEGRLERLKVLHPFVAVDSEEPAPCR